MANQQRNKRHIDWVLIALVALLAVNGLANLHSAANVDGVARDVTQFVWLMIGSAIAFLVAYSDYRHASRWAYVAFAGVCVLLVAVLIFGVRLNNSQRWLDLGEFHLQPSEPMKFAVILATARYFSENERPDGHDLRSLLPLAAMMAVPVFLILLQPDLGTAVVELLIFGSICVFERIKRSTIIALVAMAAVCAPLMWTFGMHDYQKDRVLTLLEPDDKLQGDAWQVNQAKIGIGSGGFWGKGYLEGTQVQNGFVPEHENDFIFTHHGEQFGFAGSSALVLAYLLLVLWGLRVARYARDKFGVLCAVGASSLVFWHVFVNIGMVTGVLPVVGLWLPFMSAGGSSMMSLMLTLGLLLSISNRRHVF